MNDYMRLGSTFWGLESSICRRICFRLMINDRLCRLANEVCPVPNSDSGIQVLISDTFKLHCFGTETGLFKEDIEGITD